MTADAGLRRIHRALLSQMVAQEPGVRAGLEPEFLHDFRVAGRRMRSVLSQVRHVFPVERVEHFRDELSWLGRATANLRDLDVFLETLDGLARERGNTDLEALRELIGGEQRSEHERLVAALDSPRYQTLVADLARFLDAPPTDEAELTNAARPLREVLGERMRRLHGRILKRGQAVVTDSAASELHRLRLDGKKLRYLLDGGRSLFPAAELKAALKVLRRLQDVLGRAHDLDVQSEWLARYAERLQRQERLEAPTALAMGAVIERLARRARRTQKKVGKRCARFASKRTRARFEALLAGEART